MYICLRCNKWLSDCCCLENDVFLFWMKDNDVFAMPNYYFLIFLSVLQRSIFYITLFLFFTFFFPLIVIVTTSILTFDFLCVCLCACAPLCFSSSVQHAEMADESVQLKTLQTILIIFQSHLHPESEVSNIQYHVGFQFSMCNAKVGIVVMMQIWILEPSYGDLNSWTALILFDAFFFFFENAYLMQIAATQFTDSISNYKEYTWEEKSWRQE